MQKDFQKDIAEFENQNIQAPEPSNLVTLTMQLFHFLRMHGIPILFNLTVIHIPRNICNRYPGDVWFLIRTPRQKVYFEDVNAWHGISYMNSFRHVNFMGYCPWSIYIAPPGGILDQGQ